MDNFLISILPFFSFLTVIIYTPFVAICAAYDGDKLAEIKFVNVTKDIQTCTFEFEGEWSKFKLFAWDSLTEQNNLSNTKIVD